MAGKNVTFAIDTYYKGKLHKAGDKTQVDAETYAELEELNAISTGDTEKKDEKPE